MKKIYGVIGKGKLGSILSNRPNFFFLDCDVTDLLSIGKAIRHNPMDIIVNCAAISSIDECEKNYEKAIAVNVRGLRNLHKLFEERVLNLSSDHVFKGGMSQIFPPKETSTPSPTNNYGLTKLASETVSDIFGGKTIRLSRSVSVADNDISNYLTDIYSYNKKIFVPTFFTRNYIHREFTADGIEYMVRNWDKMPKLVNYCGTDNTNFYKFMYNLIFELSKDPKDFVRPRTKYEQDAPRPRRGGLNTDLAKSLGFPMYNLSDTMSRLVKEF